jgi:hypothetical protein
VAEVVADHHDATIATNDLALIADLLDAWLNLHVFLFFEYSDNYLVIANEAITCSDR